MKRISAAKASKTFGHVQEEAEKGPVILTSYGTDRFVLMTMDDFQRLQPDTRGGPPDADASRREFHRLLSRLTTCYFSLDAEWRFMTLSHGAELFFGRTLDDLKGEPWTSAFSPDEVAKLENGLRRAMDHGEVALIMLHREAGNGDRLQLEAFRLPEPPGGIGVIFASVGEHERASRRLTLLEAQIKALSGALPRSATIVYDVEGRVEEWSAAAEELLGWSSAELLNQPVDRIFRQEDRDNGSPYREMARVRNGEEVEQLRQFVSKDGTDVAARCRLFRLPGDPGAYLELLVALGSDSANQVAVINRSG